MPMPLNDVTGCRFGRLLVTGRHGTNSNPVEWECLCDCGRETIVAYKHLAYGTTKSCGCYRAELIRRPHTHGQSGRVSGRRTPTYITWEAIKQRCHNPNATGYRDYGGRGITVCERWRDSFEAFFEDMGERPKGLTLERIQNDGDYELGNCRWATRREQASNRRNSRFIVYDDRKQTLTQWAKEYSLSRGVLWHRIYTMKWPMERALSEPVRQLNRRRS